MELPASKKDPPQASGMKIFCVMSAIYLHCVSQSNMDSECWREDNKMRVEHLKKMVATVNQYSNLMKLTIYYYRFGK